MTYDSKPMGKYQFEALNFLAASSEAYVHFWELPNTVEADAIARMATRGLIEVQIKITPYGRNQLSHVTLAREEAAAVAHRTNIRKSMKVRKSIEASKKRKGELVRVYANG